LHLQENFTEQTRKRKNSRGKKGKFGIQQTRKIQFAQVPGKGERKKVRGKRRDEPETGVENRRTREDTIAKTKPHIFFGGEWRKEKMKRGHREESCVRSFHSGAKSRKKSDLLRKEVHAWEFLEWGGGGGVRGEHFGKGS